jgi:hypothetical protein
MPLKADPCPLRLFYFGAIGHAYNCQEHGPLVDNNLDLTLTVFESFATTLNFGLELFKTSRT